MGVKPVRIVSMLPSATEMIYALGFGDSLIAVSHECDYPPQAQSKPKVVRSAFATEKMESAAIDTRVSRALRQGKSLYTIDLEVLKNARPDLIVTQDLCNVCAVTGTDLHAALRKLGLSPRILTQTPRGLEGIFSDIRHLGNTLGAASRARDYVSSLKKNLNDLRQKTQKMRHHPKVYALEWLDPPYAAGHWVPEIVEAAGGREILGKPGMDSRRITWRQIVKADPEIVVLMPCGYNAQRALEEAAMLDRIPEWRNLRAVLDKRVYAVDANAFFSRPGPRVIEGAQLLARLFFPEQISARDFDLAGLYNAI